MKRWTTAALALALVAGMATTASAKDKWNFKYSQSQVLDQMIKIRKGPWWKKAKKEFKFVDPEIRMGICASMSYDWCKRKLSDVKVTKKTYKEASFLVSAQRAYDGNFEKMGDKFWKMMAKGDKLKWGKILRGKKIKGKFSKIAGTIGGLEDGAYLLGFIGKQGGHQTALFVKGDKISFFDPNLGQITFPKGKAGKKVTKILAAEYSVDGFKLDRKVDLYRLTGTPRDAAWLKKNPGK